MGEKYIQVPALDSNKEYTLHVSQDWYNRVRGVFNTVCNENPEQIGKLYEFFMEADRSDLLNPRWWHQRAYGEKSDSREFESLVNQFERSDRLIAKHYVENRPAEEIEEILARESMPEMQ